MNTISLIVLLDPDTYIYIGWGVMLLLTTVCGLSWYFIKHRKLLYGLSVVVMLLWGAFLYGSYIGVNQLEVKHIELAFDDLPDAFDDYKIVQFSDVHIGTLTGWRHQLLERMIDSINAQCADIVVFTGDMQNKVPDEIFPDTALLAKIKAKDGVCSVLGNHDYAMYVNGLNEFEQYTNLGLRMSIDHDLGWHLLVNGRHKVRRGGQYIVIAGMDNDGDGMRFPQNGDISYALNGIKRSDFVVMLEHDSSSWKRKILPHSHTQLTLTGHTHGGQFSIFGWSLASLKYKENSGLYNEGGRYLYVSNGISGVVPFRFGVPPEITVITLRKKK